MRSTPESSPGDVRGAGEHNYTTERALRALELVVLSPASAPAIATELGVDPRTARRILMTLVKEEYVERRAACDRGGHAYHPTVRLLSMAAQLRSRLSLVRAGEHAVQAIGEQRGFTAYLGVPSYADVLVLAASGNGAIRPWRTWPASEDAVGHVLLAHRTAWRLSLRAVGDEAAADIRAQGYASVASPEHGLRSLAVAVPADETPVAALAVCGPGAELAAQEAACVALLQRVAAQVADSARAGRLAPPQSAPYGPSYW